MRSPIPRVLPRWFLLIPAVVLMNTTAHAAKLLECVGPETTKYTPGILNDPRQLSFEGKGTMLLCLGLVPGGLTVKEVVSTGAGELGCAVNTPPGPSKLTLRWSNGDTGEAEGTTVVNSKPAGELVLVQRAKIVSGPLTGANIVRTLTSVQFDVTACNQEPGVTELNGIDNIVITGQ
ncbi:hypothetical protein JYJ95_03935 [Corallococcus exiguus]|uniref:hypothetical protein n=1 Tax=Corallococcus exiguus TaxID=83462 RepID=UPI001A90210F|nr:hypothetical protein [Corallococcus exiguus]MBN8465646.1 hypothetical protein [Corallococcus exiguus]